MTKHETNVMLAGWEPIAVLARRVQTRSVTARALVERSLEAIGKAADYNALITVARTEALQRADAIDAQVAAGKTMGRLAGVPFIAKDNYLTKGIETTAASKILQGYIPPISATVIERLEAEGAIMVAKANLDAFAHGSSTENSDYGPSKNPHDVTRVPGGSSGGSAVAVALGLAPFALGTDTGGSIRLPASYCGVVGLKPTYGLVSRYGVVAMASSTDVLGPMARTVADAALVLDCMAGTDPRDGTTIEREQSYSVSDSNLDIKGLKVGVLKEYFGPGLDLEVKARINEAVAVLKEQGADIQEISVPSVELALAVYYIVVPAEVSSNLSRYDGIRYGLSQREGGDLTDLYEQTRAVGFNAENKRRIMTGTYVLSSGYYDAYYKKAQTVRTKLIDEFKTVFSDVDIIVGPTAPNVAFKLGANTEDPLEMYLTDIMTVAANLVGVPSISLPVGMAYDMPVGLQLMAAQRDDARLLRVSHALEGVLSAD